MLDKGGGEEGFGGRGTVALGGDCCAEFGYEGERVGGGVYVFYEGDSRVLDDL